MSRFQHAFNIAVFLSSALTVAAQPPAAQPPAAAPPQDPTQLSDPSAVRVLKAIAEKYGAMDRYAFEGDLEIAKQNGRDPQEVLAKAAVKLEVAPGGKFFLRVKPDKGGPEYILASDGEKQWQYVPSLNRYTERGAVPGASSSDLLYAKPGEVEPYSREIVPMIVKFSNEYEMSFQRGAVLTILTKKVADRQTLNYWTVGGGFELSRLTWIAGSSAGPVGTKVRLDMAFSSFLTGDKVPDSDFGFVPPKGSKRVDTLSIPGPGAPVAKPAAGRPHR